MSCTEEPGHMWQDTPMSCNEDDQVLRRMERSRSPQLPMHSRLWVPEIGVSGHKGPEIGVSGHKAPEIGVCGTWGRTVQSHRSGTDDG